MSYENVPDPKAYIEYVEKEKATIQSAFVTLQERLA